MNIQTATLLKLIESGTSRSAPYNDVLSHNTLEQYSEILIMMPRPKDSMLKIRAFNPR